MNLLVSLPVYRAPMIKMFVFTSKKKIAADNRADVGCFFYFYN